MRLFPDRKTAELPKAPPPMQLAAAYSVCRSISRAAARNFYYSFLALPREKRDAICAVYAFMRHADDISDEPGLSATAKRERLTDWLGRFSRTLAGEPTDDPVLLALSDAQRRYQIPVSLLEKLVAGTTMDLEDAIEPCAEGAPCLPGVGRRGEAPTSQNQGPFDKLRAGPGAPSTELAVEDAGTTRDKTPERDCVVPLPPVPEGRLSARYESFEELYQYCYHVASVVGLVCIRIFGYRDPSADVLAERCGIAFQLTNIIRDVKEDASMGRVYLPRQDLDRFGLNAAELENESSSVLAARFGPMLEFEAQRARDFYRSAEELLPLIEEDSRPALWVLVTIYRRLLDKIAARNYDVFTAKVRLTMPEKLRVLAKGIWLRLV